MGARPAGTVTFLFTDVEGSTALWEADAEAMREALAEHDAVLMSAIEAREGWAFKHTGDGVCAAFATPGAAIDAAIAAQCTLGLPVRMGIATGVAEPRGDDYFGPILNQVARVMAAGHGGQILVAESTMALVREVEALDLGERRLRDLVDPVRLFQVVAPDLRLSFPALRTDDPVPGNLPVNLASFVGRAREVADVSESVLAHRLVTLTGVGGVGKTRLAVHVASRLAEQFADGVWLVELAEVGDPAAVADAAASALGITPQRETPMTDSVAQGLAGRDVLLVLDNCEHVLDAAGDLIEAILGGSTSVKVLATSREGTGVAGEHLWTVPSLDVGSGVASDAVGLFVARAAEVDATFTMTDEDDEAAVVEVCERLDGIALAIELAAARMASMTPREICERLGDRFRLLSGGRRGMERHQTLRHTVQWSFDLLDENDRVVLQRCSVFSGGFDLPAALDVAGAGEVDEYRMLDSLDSLAKKSLLTVDRELGRTRYTMLETIRQFAEEQLVAVDEHQAVRSRHARFFARGVARNFERWAGPDQRLAYEWFDVELANLRAAFRWALQDGDLDSAATIAGKAAYPAAFHNWFEPAEWCVELIGSPDLGRHHLSRWLYMGAAQLMFVDSPAQAVSCAEAGLALRGEGLETVPHEIERCSLGLAAMFNGELERWVSLARDISMSPDDDLMLGANSYVWMLALTGAHDEAARLADDMLERARDLECPLSVAYAHGAAGQAFSRPDPQRALQSFETAAFIAGSNSLWMFEAVYRRETARLEATSGNPLTGLESLDRIISAFHRAGDSANLIPTLGYLVVALCRLERFASAATLHGAVTRHPAAAMVPELESIGTRLQDQLGTDAFDRITSRSATWDTASTVSAAKTEIHSALTDPPRTTARRWTGR